MGYVVRPLTSFAVPVPTSAVRGAKCCAVSGVTGFVVLSQRTSAVRGCKRGPRGRATVPTTKPGELVARYPSRRYGRASNGRAPAARDKTTKPRGQAGSWRYAPRTADVGMVTAQSDQGHHHVTIGSRRSDDPQASWTRQPTLRAVRRNHRGPSSLIALPPAGRLSFR